MSHILVSFSWSERENPFNVDSKVIRWRGPITEDHIATQRYPQGNCCLVLEIRKQYPEYIGKSSINHILGITYLNRQSLNHH